MMNQKKSEKMQSSIISYSALGIFCISLLISSLSLLPFYRHLKDDAERRLLSEVRIRIMAIEEYLLRGKDIAAMIANRTQVRKRLEEYNAGQITLADLKAGNQPALLDSLNSSPEIAGISQLDAKGNQVIQCGLTIPKEYWPMGLEQDNNLLISEPVSIGREIYLIISAPVINREYIRVGTDIILFRTPKLQRILKDSTGLGQTGKIILGTREQSQLNFAFGLSERQNINAKPVLGDEAFNEIFFRAAQQKKEGIISVSSIPAQQSIIAYGSIAGSQLILAVKINKNELYSPIYRQVFILSTLIIGLILLGVYGMFLLLRPLTGKIIIHTDELNRQIKEKTVVLQTILDSMPFGVVIVGRDQRIRQINKAALVLIGENLEREIIGRVCNATLCPAEKGKCPILDLGQNLDKSECLLVTKVGGKIPILKTVVPITLEGEGVLLEAFVDITERKKAEETLKRLSSLDGLTGIANRRHFDEIINLEWKRSLREGEPLSLIMADIDFFKFYNDTYGHQCGDDCLKKVAAAIKKGLKRPGDLVARYGGEEFAVILPDTPLEGAQAVAEDLRLRIEALGIIHAKSPLAGKVTVSLGVASILPKQDLNVEALILAADQALYRAKNEGRNCIRTAG